MELPDPLEHAEPIRVVLSVIPFEREIDDHHVWRLFFDLLEKLLGVGCSLNLESRIPQCGGEHFTHQLVVFEDRDPHRTLRLSISLPAHDCFIHCRTVFVKPVIGALFRASLSCYSTADE